MERLLQYLDDLEDFYYAIALLMERVRKAAKLAAFVLVFSSLLCLGILLALSSPPLALAVVSLLIVSFLYFGATGRFRAPHREI